MSNSCFNANGVLGYGGALHVKSATIIDSAFERNIGFMGGALYSAADVTVVQCTFDANSADYGGAVFAAGSLSIQKHTVIQNCSAWTNGGAIFSASTMEVTESTIRHFAPGDLGAAVYHNVLFGEILFIRAVKFEDVALLYIESWTPNTVIVSNCELNATDVQLSSLVSCDQLAEIDQLGEYCEAEYCHEASVGVEVRPP